MKPIINTRKGKREFIRALMASLKKQLLESVGKMPAEWDGHELRELIADITQGERTNEMKTNRRRARDYRSERYSRNLP